MSKKVKNSKKQTPITLYTVAADKAKMWTVPEDEEMSSQPLHKKDTSNAGITKKVKSPLDVTFTAPRPSVEDGVDPNDPNSNLALQVDPEKSKKAKKVTDYTALEFASSSSQTNSVDADDDGKEPDLEHLPEDERILTSLVALFLELFKPIWSLGVGYYYYSSGNYVAAYIMTIIIFISGFCTHVVYFASRTSPIRKIWKSSKIISLLCAIPFVLPIVLALCNCVFAIKEARSRMYERPWTNTLSIFMAESLTLAFPQCILQMCLLLEHYTPFPSISGLALLFGILVFSLDITFTRIRHDAHKRYDRFGEKFGRLFRYSYIWANKVIWFSTYAIVIVSLRLCFPNPDQIFIATTLAAAGIFFVHEVVVIVAVLPIFNRIVQSMVGLFFIFPQFVALLALIIWVNTDKTIYDTNIGSLFLGGIFWSEVIILAGWLFDRGVGKDPDFLPAYPHFTGDVFTFYCQ